MEQKQDLRTLFNQKRASESFKLKTGHKDRFLKRLDHELPQKSRSSWFVFKIAASVVLVAGLSFYWYANYSDSKITETTIVNTNQDKDKIKNISLGDLSPDLKKIEQYYVATINLELAQLKISDENKTLVESYMEGLAELNAEYQVLTAELNTIGPNDQTISALIQNLQLRLQLLKKLKEKLTELKSSKNETAINI